MSFRPWWLTLAGKLVLSRLPVRYGFWARLGLFRHGGMDDAAYAMAVFDAHANAAGLPARLDGRRIVELGPGDSVATAIIAASRGASAVLIDAGDFASKDVLAYRRIARAIDGAPMVDDCRTLTELLDRCHGSQYLTAGLDAMCALPEQSIDFLFSNAVLEHVEHDQFDELVREMKRVMKPSGVMSHEIDLRDHLGGGKNNLRFATRTWTSPWFRSAGFYTNRIACSAIRASFIRQGFAILHEEVVAHTVKPSRHILAAEFAGMSDADLNAAIYKIVLKA